MITIGTFGTLSNSGSHLVAGGGSRTTINLGGTLSTSVDTTIELNGALLVNNGTQTGVLIVNYGSTAKGNGSFGTVNVNDGGRFGTNATSSGAFANRLNGGGLVGTPSLARSAMVGPQLAVAPSTATVGSLSLGSGGVLAVNVNDATGGAGSGYDTVGAGGALTLGGDNTAGNQITIALSSLSGNGTSGAAVNFDPNQPYVLTLVTADGGITGFSTGNFTVDASAFQNNLGGGHFFLAQDGNSLDLDFAPIPEPATCLGGMLLGLLGAVTWQRRSRRIVSSRPVDSAAACARPSS